MFLSCGKSSQNSIHISLDAVGNDDNHNKDIFYRDGEMWEVIQSQLCSPCTPDQEWDTDWLQAGWSRKKFYHLVKSHEWTCRVERGYAGWSSVIIKEQEKSIYWRFHLLFAVVYMFITILQCSLPSTLVWPPLWSKGNDPQSTCKSLSVSSSCSSCCLWQTGSWPCRSTVASLTRAA